MSPSRMTGRYISVQFKIVCRRLVSRRWGKPICTPPRLSKVSPHIKWVQYVCVRSPVPMSPPGSYGSQVTAQLHDSPLSPTSRGGYVQQNHHSPATHTTLPDGSTRIQIQRSGGPAQQPAGPPLPPTPKAYEDSSPFSFSEPRRMPDYTIPYKQADPYHEHAGSGSGMYDDDVYR